MCNQTVHLNDTISTLDLEDFNGTSTACIWNLHSLNDTTIVVKVNDVVLEGHLDRVTALDGTNENSSVIQQCGSECSKLNGNIFLNLFLFSKLISELKSTYSERKLPIPI